MWILWKMRLWKCEFCEKMRIWNCEFYQKWGFDNVNFWINSEFLPQCGLYSFMEKVSQFLRLNFCTYQIVQKFKQIQFFWRIQSRVCDQFSNRLSVVLCLLCTQQTPAQALNDPVFTLCLPHRTRPASSSGAGGEGGSAGRKEERRDGGGCGIIVSGSWTYISFLLLSLRSNRVVGERRI